MTASTEKIRVALCDDHDLFRCGVAEMLSFAEDVEVVGEAKERSAVTRTWSTSTTRRSGRSPKSRTILDPPKDASC